MDRAPVYEAGRCGFESYLQHSRGLVQRYGHPTVSRKTGVRLPYP